MIDKESRHIKGPRITLYECTRDLCILLMQEDNEIEKKLGLRVPDKWNSFGAEMFAYSLDQLESYPGSAGWLSYIAVENTLKTLLGTCGYKGRVDHSGAVEIGYEVAESFRNRGYATEIAELLIKNAMDYPDIRTIRAHTLPEENASVRVLRKCGFHYISALEDPDDGLIWRWELKLQS